MLLSHFSEAEDPNLASDLSPEINLELSRLFGKMQNYYMIESKMEYRKNNSQDLWFIYGALEDIFEENAADA